MPSLAKRLFEKLAVRLAAPRMSRRWRADSTLVLAYHNVVPPGEVPGGDQSLHLPWPRFVRQIEELEATHDLVPLDRALEAGPSDGTRPRVALTFDDAYRGAVSSAIPYLVDRGHPATIFVAPGCLGGAGFWWDRLAGRDGAGLSPELREHVLREEHGSGERIEAWARREGLEPSEPPRHARPIDEEGLREVAAQPGIRVAAHSWSHPNLVRLTDEELRSELRTPLEWLDARLDSVDPWIAYPYGFADDRVRKAARTSGYVAGLRVDGGWIGRDGPADPFRVPRLNVPADLSDEGFVLRVSGLLPG